MSTLRRHYRIELVVFLAIIAEEDVHFRNATIMFMFEIEINAPS